MAQCTLQADNVFGPAINPDCRGGFDFTLLFEQSFLGILPAAVFLLSFPTRYVFLTKESTKTSSSIARWAKMALALLFFALQLTLLLLWSVQKSDRTKVSIASAAVNLVVALQILVLTWIEDSRSVRPSTLLNSYLVFTLLFDIAQSRTLWLRHGSDALSAVFTSSIAVKAALLLLEARGKRNHLHQAYQDLPPESTSGIINRSFLWWVNDLFRKGIRALVTFEDLYILDRTLSSEGLSETLRRSWDERRNPERRFELPWIVCKAFWKSLLLAVFPRVCLIGFTFAQPFLITRVLDLLSRPSNQSTSNEGYGLIGATALIYLGIAITTLHYNQSIYRFITMFRGATVALIYHHSLIIQDGLYSESAAVTLMSADVDRIALTLTTLNECWARTIEVVVGIILLALQLGWVCVVPIIVVVVSFYGSTTISKTIGGRQKDWIDSVQKRVSITSSMLSGMKSVKMMGLSRVLTEKVQELRVEETHRMAGYRSSIVWQNVVQNLPWAIAPALTFTVYAAQAVAQGTSSLNTTQAFTSLSIITLVTNPAAQLLSAIPSTAASVGCFDRIQNFLLLPARVDQRDSFETTSGSNPTSPTKYSPLSSNETELARVKQQLPDSDLAVLIKDMDLRPSPSADLVLRNVNLEIPRRSLTFIIGAVGSGKTTLLRAILGELAFEASSSKRALIRVCDKRIAYCAQTSWLPNTTVRQAICGPTSSVNYDEKWYRTVISACALDHDIRLFTDGDQTKIGSGGAALSGGQKHRIALARAVYARAEIVLLDDILSALDSKTQSSVMNGLLGGNGIFRKLGTTVLLVTHATQYIPYADKVVLLADGCIRYDGDSTGILQQGLVSGISLKETTNVDKESDKPSIKDKNSQVSKVSELEDLARATGDFDVYSYYFRYIGWFKGAVFVGFVVINVFSSTFGQIWLKWWSEIGGGQIGLYISVYIILGLASLLAMGGYVWAILIYISPSTARTIHYTLLRTVMRAPQSFFSSTDIGTILNRFTQDMTLIEGSLGTGVLVTVSNLLMSIAAASLVASGSSYMALSIPFLILVIGCLQHVYLRTSRQLRLLDLEARSPLYSHFLETLGGLITIRAFGWEDSSARENHRLLDCSQQPYYLLYCIQRWLDLVLDLIVGAEAVLVVGLAVGLRGSTSPGLLGVSLNNILTFNNHLASLVSGWTMLETSLGSIARIRNFEHDVKPEDKAEEVFEPPKTWPSEGEVEFINVTASHDATAIGIRNVSLQFKPKQKIGICGRTGSGKSSLVATLLRLLEINEGKIKIDGIDLATIPRDTIRERLVVIPQDTMMLIGSIRLNADPNGTRSDRDVIAALERVGLWSSLQERGGLDVDMSASSLSQGQQQLFALARAILKQGKILLLDEATSNVDLDTDATMQRVIREDFAGCTTITIAHRLDTIMASDIIVVMDGGSVAEVGNPAALLQSESHFAELVKE